MTVSIEEHERYKRCLYRANGRLIQLGQEPEKLDYADSHSHETDEQRWRHEAEGTLDKLYAFLQAKNVPHAVDTRDWIDNALRVLDAYEPAQKASEPPKVAYNSNGDAYLVEPKASAAPQRCPWTDNGSPCIYVEGHTAPHVSEVRAKAVSHPATSQNGSEQR